jgi:hypothetical protein
MARFQRGSLRIESRKKGNTWVLRYFVTRDSDGRRVEHKIPIGLVQDLPAESAVWAQVERQHLQLNEPDYKPRLTFTYLARHFMEHELGEQTEATDPKSHHNCRLQTHFEKPLHRSLGEADRSQP